MTVADRMEALRDHFGRRGGISGPQYTLLMAVMQLGDGAGVPLSEVAAHLRVTRAFVTLEAGAPPEAEAEGWLAQHPGLYTELLAPGFVSSAFANPIFVDADGNGSFDPPGL